ncbi:MAG: Metal dependent phosphohydrolase [uncultured bacterium (gcode 4)]|uniref:Metal dependent phosphohydrolase n=1 Tax=uncultured bacterium (gcode 4) TaxID=1234023 RepID=K2A2M0_9BACT|nr:MAG: Metal dependent phosphohydrolase [uncultured bacterium (gcode 4)]
MHPIEKLEEEIKYLHCNPTISKQGLSDAETKELYNSFWNIHVKSVIEYSKQMAKKYNANLDVVWLGALLHDIARLEDLEPHDEIGSEKAYNLLIEKGFDRNLAEKVKNVVLKHRCRKYPPETLEEKIIASADAMAHFLPPFYLWIVKYSTNDFPEFMERNSRKIDRDYHEKIFFDEEREMIEEQYSALKKWFDFKIK